MNREPVAVGAAVIAFCNAVLGVLMLVNEDITTELAGALNLVIVAAVGLVGAIVRAYVTPVEPRNPDVESYYER